MGTSAPFWWEEGQYHHKKLVQMFLIEQPSWKWICEHSLSWGGLTLFFRNPLDWNLDFRLVKMVYNQVKIQLPLHNRHLLYSASLLLEGKDPQWHGRNTGKGKWKGQGVQILSDSILRCWCNPRKSAISFQPPKFYERSYSSSDNKRNTGG